MSPADSGEYVCRVVGGSVPLESSVLVSIEPADSVPGEWWGFRGEAPHSSKGRTPETSRPYLHSHPPLPASSQLGIHSLPSVPSAGGHPPGPDRVIFLTRG